MAIPGLKPKFEVRAKVRIGEKKKTAGGKEYPAATDHFLCDDPEFAALCGDKPKSIRVRFPFPAADDNFGTGLELWRGALLLCYSKGEGDPPIAYRKQTIKKGGQDVSTILPGDEPRGPVMGNDRLPITCRFRSCPLFEKRECRPMGRLVFFLDGGRTDSVLELDTKAWNSIEKLTAALAGAAVSGPLTGRVFDLSVEIVQKGRDRYPVLNIQEADVVKTDQQLGIVAALAAVERAKAAGAEPRAQLAAALDETNPGWRNDQRFIDRIKEVGVDTALTRILKRASELAD